MKAPVDDGIVQSRQIVGHRQLNSRRAQPGGTSCCRSRHSAWRNLLGSNVFVDERPGWFRWVWDATLASQVKTGADLAVLYWRATGRDDSRARSFELRGRAVHWISAVAGVGIGAPWHFVQGQKENSRDV